MRVIVVGLELGLGLGLECRMRCCWCSCSFPHRASCSESVFSTFKASCAASFAFCHSFILRCAFEIITKVGPMNAKWAASTAVAVRHVSMASAC